MTQIVGTLSEIAHHQGELSGESTLEGAVSRPAVISPDVYAGPYEFTPADEAQTVEIKDQIARQNIIINPVPSYYGRITWNGSVITVS